MAAAETQNPRRNIPKACKKVFARVLIFYILAGKFVNVLFHAPAADIRQVLIVG
ncbi:MAG: hypothetical protein EOO38_08940, partial [Cytophagaceae bacterium]